MSKLYTVSQESFDLVWSEVKEKGTVNDNGDIVWGSYWIMAYERNGLEEFGALFLNDVQIVTDNIPSEPAGC